MNEGTTTSEGRTLVHEEIPTTPEGLHSWIVGELGDTELARRVSERPDLTEEYIEGDGLPSIPFFAMAQEISSIDKKLGRSLLGVAIENDRLLEVSFDRIVGRGFTEAEKEEYLLQNRFERTEDASVPFNSEREKIAWELEAISYADKKWDELRSSFGLEPFPIIPEQVHTLSDNELIGGATGRTSMIKGGALLSESEVSVYRLDCIFHELLHLKAYSAAQIKQDPASGKIGVRSYRMGVKVESREINSDESYLRGLNEAITEELTNRLVGHIPDDHPVFGEMLREHRKKIATMAEKEPEVFDELNRPIWATGFEENEAGSEELLSVYRRERQIMFRLFNAIYTANPERFSGKSKEEAEEEMFGMLAKGAFTGNILPFGRLFNEAFGRGKFREFGHLQTNKEQEDFLRTL